MGRTGVVMVATSIGKKFHPRSETSQQYKTSDVDKAARGGGGKHRILVAWGRHEVNLWQACTGISCATRISAGGHAAQSIAQSSRVQRANRQSRYKKWANFVRKHLQTL